MSIFNKSPFEHVLGPISLPRSQKESLSQVFSNILALVFIGLVCFACVLLYYILESFMRPLLWATLCGSFLYPFKSSISIKIVNWIQSLKTSSIPITVGFTTVPFRISYKIIAYIFSIWKLNAFFYIGIVRIILSYFITNVSFHYDNILGIFFILKRTYSENENIIFTTLLIILSFIIFKVKPHISSVSQNLTLKASLSFIKDLFHYLILLIFVLFIYCYSILCLIVLLIITSVSLIFGVHQIRGHHKDLSFPAVMWKVLFGPNFSNQFEYNTDQVIDDGPAKQTDNTKYFESKNISNTELTLDDSSTKSLSIIDDTKLSRSTDCVATTKSPDLIDCVQTNKPSSMNNVLETIKSASFIDDAKTSKPPDNIDGAGATKSFDNIDSVEPEILDYTDDVEPIQTNTTATNGFEPTKPNNTDGVQSTRPSDVTDGVILSSRLNYLSIFLKNNESSTHSSLPKYFHLLFLIFINALIPVDLLSQGCIYIIYFIVFVIIYLWNNLVSLEAFKDGCKKRLDNSQSQFTLSHLQLIPNPLLWILKFARFLDRKLLILLEKWAEKVISILIICLLFFVILTAAFLTVFMVQGESLHLYSQTSRLVNQTVNSDLKQYIWLPNGAALKSTVDTMANNTYLYGREWITSKVHSILNPDSDDKYNREEMERNLLMIWDKMYAQWLNRQSLLNHTEIESYTSFSISHIGTNLMKLRLSTLSLNLVNFVKENIGVFMTIADSIWVVLKGNISILLNLFASSVSFLFFSGTALFNFIFSSVCFCLKNLSL